MPVLQIEHPVNDFETWKAAFDREQPRRDAGGVRRYQVYRPVDDARFIGVDLEFDSRGQAEAFRQGLEELWGSPRAAAVLGGTPRARIVDVVESRQS